MPINLTDFHFIRIDFLWLLIPVLLLLISMHQSSKKQSAWQKIISPHLLKFLVTSGTAKNTRTGVWLSAVIALLSIIALSGPSFRQKTIPAFQTDNAQIILLDLSLSMDATDIKPSRIERAKFKLMDLLSATKEGTIGLVVYAGDAFVISPLTSDSKTVANMVPTLSTAIMPVFGSRPDLAIEKSIELLKNAKYSQGQIVWLTDGVEENYIEKITTLINQSQYNLSILAIGTEQGAPIPLRDGNGFLKDRTGSIVVPKLLSRELNQIATNTDAGIIQLTADNLDIEYLLQRHLLNLKESSENQQNEQKINRWVDDGYWLVWIILLLMMFKLFRRPENQLASYSGLALLLLITSSWYAPSVQAISLDDLLFTQKQQANRAFEQKEYDKAATLFEDPQWRATAQFKNEEFEQAANLFANSATELGLYNQATSLAKANKLEDALALYNQLLESKPKHEDAIFNKKLIEELLKQQEQQQQDSEDQNKEKNKDQEQSESESDSDAEKNSEQQSEEQKQSEQEKQAQQQAEQQETEQKEMQVTEDERDKSEKDQALEHWLEKIPDDPGGLLRRKMYREYQRRGRQQKEEILW